MADGSFIDDVYVDTLVSALVDLTGIILEKGAYVQINQETESTAGSCTIIGHFEQSV